jgi:hypothetical protein
VYNNTNSSGIICSLDLLNERKAFFKSNLRRID